MKCPNCNKEVILQFIKDIHNLGHIVCPKCGRMYDVELKDDTDWNSIRNQASIAAMQAIITSDSLRNAKIIAAVTVGDLPHKEIAEASVRFADALIAELNKGK